MHLIWQIQGKIIFVPLSASELVQVSGGNQEGNIGTALLDPLKARITDKYGNAIVNFPIHFNVLGGGGTIFENQPMYTDSSGEASATFVLGRETSVNNLAEARVEGLNNSSVLFMASVTDNSAQTLSRVSGNSQSGSAGFVLPEPFIVRVTDENNKPVWNFPVEFEVTEGNGLFYGESSKIIRTDYAGYASAQFVLARELGTNRASVLANGLSGSPLSFSAQGTVGEAARLQYVQGDSQTVEVNSQLPLALKVQVTDFYGNGIGSYPVLFNIIEGEAQFLENQQQITDTNGFASISMQLGHTAGPVIVEAQALDLIDSSVQFFMEATASAAASLALYSGSDQKGTINRALPFPLKVIVKDINNNPVSNVVVNWNITNGDGSLSGGTVTTTNEKGIAENKLILGPDVGENTVYAFNTGFQVSPVLFSSQGVENKFPLFSQVGDKVINENQTLIFNLNATDDDGDPVTYGVLDLPQGADFDSLGNRQFSWTPDFSQSGEYEVTFLAFDNRDGVGAETVTITVNNMNHAPQIDSYRPSENYLAIYQSENDVIHFSVSASDIDNEPISYYWTQTTLGETLVVSKKNYFDFTAVENLNAPHKITVHVTDGIDTVEKTWNIDIMTLVELVSFTAEVDQYKGIKLEWQTSSETNNIGYNVYKSQSKEGVYNKINDMLVPSRDNMMYQYFDSSVQAGQTYYYKLEDVSKYGVTVQHEPIKIEMSVPGEYQLLQNYPNPFNPSTTINFQIPVTAQVSLKIYNINGQQVRTLIENVRPAGYYASVWDGRNNNGIKVPSGIYFYSLQTEGYTQTKRMLLIK